MGERRERIKHYCATETMSGEKIPAYQALMEEIENVSIDQLKPSHAVGSWSVRLKLRTKAVKVGRTDRHHPNG